MRRALAFICYGLMLTADGFAAYFTYRAYTQSLSYQYAILYFVPTFIAAYWFATFFSQLILPKEGKLISHRLYKVLSWISTILTLALIGAWIYLFISRSLYDAMRPDQQLF